MDDEAIERVLEEFLDCESSSTDSSTEVHSYVEDLQRKAAAAKKPENNRKLFLLCGIELEMMIKPNYHLEALGWEDVAQQLSVSLTEHHVEHEVLEKSKTSDYKKWIIAADSSLKTHQIGNECGIELVSNPMLLGPWLPFRFGNLWKSLTSKFNVSHSTACGTHIHVSIFIPPKDRNGANCTFDTLKGIAKAAVFFERCIDSLMPTYRLQNKYCRSNRYNAVLRKKTLWDADLRQHCVAAMLQLIDDIQEQPDSPGGPDGYQKLVDFLCPKHGNMKSRFYRWNFTPLLRANEKTRTIEFRQPPGCEKESDAVLWLSFTLIFVYGASNCFGEPGRSVWNGWETATMDDLRKMLEEARQTISGSLITKWNIADLFTGKELLPDSPTLEPLIGTDDLEAPDINDTIEQLNVERIDAYAEELEVENFGACAAEVLPSNESSNRI